MSEGKPAPPALFSAEGTAGVPQYPALLGGRCTACGGVFFPMQNYGCERCGAVALEPVKIAGRGKLVASAQVHMPAHEHRPAPFTVGSIVTDEGAIVRAVLNVAPGTKLTPGTVMVTCLVPENRPNRGEQDLRFMPAEGR